MDLKCSNWDLTNDDLLMDDRVGLHMLYVQMVSDIENGWIVVPKEVLKQLTALQSQGSKKDVNTVCIYFNLFLATYCIDL